MIRMGRASLKRGAILPPTTIVCLSTVGRSRLMSLVFLVVALPLAVCCVGLSPLTAQDDEEMGASREYRIKAAYLYQFGRYVEWPAKSFPTPQSPFVIGVMKEDPIAADLEQIARIKKIQDRPIQVRRFSSPNEISSRVTSSFFPFCCRRRRKRQSSVG